MNTHIGYALGAYMIWGAFPLYWKWLQHIPALQLLSHRIVWSFVLLFFLLFLRRKWKEFRQNCHDTKQIKLLAIAALLLSINWLTYVWAVNAGYIVETSLGYFINPLVSVFLGVVFLGERLKRLQWVAIALAGIGVLYLTLKTGSFPWIALTLAFSFGFYGFLKKKTTVGSIQSITFESGILLLPALAYLLYSETQGTAGFLHHDLHTDLLIIGAGIVTTIPLLLFAEATKHIPLNIIGMLQYSAPTLQLLIGVWVFHEDFGMHKAIGFGFVWAGLLLFILESVRTHKKRSR